jgi:signal transduction histidine kinase
MPRLHRASAADRLERLTALQSLLARLSQELGPALSLQPVLTSVLDAMRSLVDFKGGSICLVEEGQIGIAAHDPPVTPDVLAARLPVGKGLAGRVVATGRPVYSPDLDTDERVDQELRRLGSNITMKSYLGVPLVCLGEIIGLLQVDSSQADAFSADDLAILEGLAVQVAGAIESARRYEHVKELEQLKNDFVARVTHELRTPLSVLSASVDLLGREVSRLSPDDRRKLADGASNAVGRLRYLIDELLSVTTLESGAVDPQPVEVRVVDVLAQVRADSEHPSRIDLAAPDDIRVEVDPALLRQGLGLLVDNAFKYAGPGRVTLQAAVGEGWVEIAVADEGPGVPPELRDRIFERFFRAEHETSGMGLGLALARTLATSLGASLSCEDVPDGGARFVMRFAALPL